MATAPITRTDPTASAAFDEARAASELTDRESELVRRSGERIYELSRRLSASEQETVRLRSELQYAHSLLEEARRTRDVLGAQVESLIRERDREFDERAQLRQLLAGLQSQVQGLIAGSLGREASPNGPRVAPAEKKRALPAPRSTKVRPGKQGKKDRKKKR